MGLPDGTSAYRRPETWEELADCVDKELKSRADVRAPGERINAVGNDGGKGTRNRKNKPKENLHTVHTRGIGTMGPKDPQESLARSLPVVRGQVIGRKYALS